MSAYSEWLGRRPTDETWVEWQEEGSVHGWVFPAVQEPTANASVGHAEGSVSTVDAVPDAGAAAPPDDSWPLIEPLQAEAALPDFPLDTLPGWMAGMADATAANCQTDVSMAAVTTLGLASVPISNRYEAVLRVWTERVIGLYTCAIAETGELKSATFGTLTEPLLRHEREVRELEGPDLRDQRDDDDERRVRLKMAQQALAKALKDYVTDSGHEPEGASLEVAAARKRIRSIQAEIDAADEESLRPYALLADDSTPEALQRQMADQDGRVGIVSPESELFPMAAGRYSDSGPKIQPYLSGFSGEPLRGDRITRVLPPVERPGLGIVISVQPIVFHTACRNAYLQRRGLLGRFLYAVPMARAGSRRLD